MIPRDSTSPTTEATLRIPLEDHAPSSYFKLPFDVADDIETLEIAFERTSYETTLGDDGFVSSKPGLYIILGLENPEGRVVGFLRSYGQPNQLSAHHASEGLTPTALTPGAWSIVVGYKGAIPQDFAIHATITQTPCTWQRLRGDTHLHTRHSDGSLSVPELMQRARQNKLDYMILTDHNTYSGNKALHSDATLTCIPGVEFTLFGGHTNFLGVDEVIDSFYIESFDDVQAAMASARQQGALVVLNHPFDRTFHLEWTYPIELGTFDLLEIWNGPFTERNQLALNWWHARLQEGHRIPIIGGSDFHRDLSVLAVGTPSTIVFAKSRSQSHILDSLRAGRSFLVADTDSPYADLRTATCLMGVTAASEADTACHAHVTRIKERDLIKVITATSLDEILVPAHTSEWQRSLPLKKDAKFIRLEVWRPDWNGIRQLVTLTNPIYID